MITVNWGRYESDFDRGKPAAGGDRRLRGGVRRRDWDWDWASMIGPIGVTVAGQGAAEQGRA